MSKIIDTHHHLWDLKKLSYPWLMNHVDTFLGNYDKIRKNYLLNDFVKDSELIKLEKSVHIQAEFDHKNDRRFAWGV